MKSALSLSSVLVASVSIVALACSVAPAAAPAPTVALAELAQASTVANAQPVAAVAAVAPATAGDECIDVDDEHGGGKRITLEGRLVIDTEFAHPARGKTRPFILRLESPRCAVGTREPRVVEVHLASGEGVELKPLLDRRVRVTGEPFAAHTAWHARDVVFMTASVSAL
jgi:hypothetical protein